MDIKKKYLNIRDIAMISGYSIATVSRAINTPELIPAKTKDKILQVIDKHGYIPNQYAKNIFSGCSNSIALFVYEMGNPFYVSLIRQLNSILFKNGYTLLICDVGDDSEIESRYYDYCRSIRVSGIIYTAGSLHENFDYTNKNPTIPIVAIDRECPKDSGIFSVHSDNKKAMQLVVNYLNRLNHRKIGFVCGSPNVISAQQRLAGFFENMERLHLVVPERYIFPGVFSVQTGISAFDYFYSLSDTPTAIITADDQIARGFIMRANSLGVNIPGEFSVCGIDGLEDLHFYPRITSVKQNIEEIALTAFSIILDNKEPASPHEIVIDVSLLYGQTCRKI